jgi:hypothetical protein
MQFVETPVQAIKSAIELFVFACFINDAVAQKLITPKSFSEKVRLDEGGHGLDFTAVFGTDQLKAHAHNMTRMSLGTTAIATNKAIEAVFGELNPADTSPDGSARVILYQIRCAFAHDPLNPVWTPHTTKYNHTYRVTVQGTEQGNTMSHTIVFHPPTLRNKHLGADDFGGLGAYMGLLYYFRAKIEGNAKGNMPYPPPIEESQS